MLIVNDCISVAISCEGHAASEQHRLTGGNKSDTFSHSRRARMEFTELRATECKKTLSFSKSNPFLCFGELIENEAIPALKIVAKIVREKYPDVGLKAWRQTKIPGLIS